MTHREAVLLAALMPAIAACPVADAECFGHDECAPDHRCVALACVPRAPDAGPRDGGEVEARDGGEGCPARDRDRYGLPLDDGQSGLGDAVLVHFDDAQPPLTDRAGGDLAVRCTPPGCPAFEACGVYDGAYAFDGVDDVFAITGDLDFDISGAQYGLEAWVRIDATSTATMCLFDYDDGVSPGIELAVFPDGAVGNAAIRSAPTAIRDGDWHHVALIRQVDTAVSVDVDRTTVASGVFDGTIVEPATTIHLGACTDGRSLAGALDEVRLSSAHPERDTDLSITRPDVVVAWEQGNAIHLGNERLSTTRVIVEDGAFPAVSGDGASVAYLVCDGACALHEQAVATGDDVVLATTGDILPGRIAYLEATHVFYLAGAPCAAAVYRYDRAFEAATRITDPGPYILLEIGRRSANVTGAALYLAAEACGGGTDSVLRIDDPGDVMAPVAPIEIHSVDSSMFRVTDVTASPSWDALGAEVVFVLVEPPSGPADSVTRVLTPEGARQPDRTYAGAVGRFARPAFTSRYDYLSGTFDTPFAEANLEILLHDALLGRTQALTNDAIRSARPSVWYRLY